MIKYIKVDWPESQEFMEYKEETFVCADSENTLFVPENLYNEVMYKLQFPKKYENTNLGTIVCYETRAVVNENETFWYDLSDLKKGNKILIYNYSIPSEYNKPEWFITTCKACSQGFPILLEDAIAIPGLNCEIIGYYDPNETKNYNKVTYEKENN